MTIDMDKLDRAHYLKHYIGAPVLVSDENHMVSGQLEQIEFEDGSALVKSGNESHWYDGKIVSPSLKQFKNLTTEDIHCIVDHMVFQKVAISESEIISINCQHGSPLLPGGCWLEMGIFIHLTNHRIIWVTPNWVISGLKNLGCIDNIGTIIFLLCEMGYDVIGLNK